MFVAFDSFDSVDVVGEAGETLVELLQGEQVLQDGPVGRSGVLAGHEDGDAGRVGHDHDRGHPPGDVRDRHSLGLPAHEGRRQLHCAGLFRFLAQSGWSGGVFCFIWTGRGSVQNAYRCDGNDWRTGGRGAGRCASDGCAARSTIASSRAVPGVGKALRGRPEVTSGNGLTEAFGAAGVGAWVWYTASGLVSLDEHALGLLGIDPDTYDGHVKTWLRLVHPDDIAWASAEVGKSLRTFGPYEVEYRICCPDGATRWVQVRGRVEPDGNGSPYRVLGTIWDSTESHIARDGVRRALRLMSDGFLSIGQDWRITFANVQAERQLGSALRLTGQVLWDLPVIGRVPGLEACCREAATGMKPVGFEAEWPDTGRWYLFRFVPVPDGMAWYFTDITKSRQRRAERAAAERAAAERAARIQELTAALAEAVTSQDVVTAVAERVLPPFGASGLFVEVVEADHLRVVGSVGYPQSYVSLMDGLPLRKAPAIASALDGHRPFFLSSPEEFAERFPEVADLPDVSGKRAWAFMPLVVSGQVIGLCVVSFGQPRDLASEERAVLVALSGLMAQALERARLFDAEHARAQALQRDLLPQMLPSLPAVAAAARYLPAGPGASVGGDWYDVVPLSGGRVALVIGDVMGHGLPEAVIMGRLRTAVQTLSDLDLPPDEIMGHVNEVVNGIGDDWFFATCLYAVYDPVAGSCTIARAGHPPPAVVGRDGVVRFAEAAADPPLGVADPPFAVVELAVPDGGLLVFYTDGLIESADVDADSGMGRLAGLLRMHHRESLDQLCDSLTRGLLQAGSQRTDDAALLAVRVHATAPDAVVTWSLPKDPLSARAARRHVREQLSAWRLDELAASTEMLASELVTNVVRHARGPIQLRLLRSQTLVCEVFDGSLTTPRIRRATWSDEGGRGLQLVAALCDRWGTRYMAEGKCIWTEQSLPLPKATPFGLREGRRERWHPIARPKFAVMSLGSGTRDAGAHCDLRAGSARWPGHRGCRVRRCPAAAMPARTGSPGTADGERAGHALLRVAGDRAQVAVGAGRAGGEGESPGVHPRCGGVAEEPQRRAREGGPGGRHRHPRGPGSAGGDDQAVGGVVAGVDELHADAGTGLDDDGGVDHAGDPEGLIGAAGWAGEDGEADGRIGESDAALGAAGGGVGRDLAAEPGGLGQADPGTGGVGEQRAHDLSRVGGGAHHEARQRLAAHPGRGVGPAHHPPVAGAAHHPAVGPAAHHAGRTGGAGVKASHHRPVIGVPGAAARGRRGGRVAGGPAGGDGHAGPEACRGEGSDADHRGKTGVRHDNSFPCTGAAWRVSASPARAGLRPLMARPSVPVPPWQEGPQ